jgi:peptide deformylase
LAAPQVGVHKQLLVIDLDPENSATPPMVLVNPEISSFGAGIETYEEGCLSVPGLSWEITRPNAVHLVGLDLDGNEISIETDEFEGRVFQHEMDHLDGILLIERLDEDQRKKAKKILLKRQIKADGPDPDGLRRLLGFSR